MKVVHLEPIKESTEDYESIEQHIAELFKKEIYAPLLALFKTKKNLIKNSQNDLIDAIISGRLTFYRGKFKGRLNSGLSRDLRKIGAEWDRKQGCWTILFSALPMDVRSAISVSEFRFNKQMELLDKTLAQILPEQIAEKIQVQQLFDSTLWRADNKIKESFRAIRVEPTFTAQMRGVIAKEYEQTTKLNIKDWTQKEIQTLRQKVKSQAFNGQRYEDIISTIQKSYSVSHSKAKFLARQETNLLLSKFKETRYAEAGVREYTWCCVAGSANHEVRPMHKALEGKTFRFDKPPIVNESGERKNPGEDFNCRCFARPLVRFN